VTISVTYTSRNKQLCFHAVVGTARKSFHHIATSVVLSGSQCSVLWMFTVHLENRKKTNSYPVVMTRTAAFLFQKDMSFHQGCKFFFMGKPNIHKPSIWNLLHFTLLAPRILRFIS
jgi:hypothetical protein